MLLSLHQVAERIGAAVQTIKHWRHRTKHGLPLHPAGVELVGLMVAVGRNPKIDDRDLERWVARHRARISPQPDADELNTKLREVADLLLRAGRADAAAMARALLREEVP
jgi:hypothetical protein